MKLKFININGYGVLVDEINKPTGEIYEWVYNLETHEVSNIGEIDENDVKIIFAEKELKLEGVPVFDWRDWEINKKANEVVDSYDMFLSWREPNLAFSFFVQGYKANQAKYTEEDLMKIINIVRNDTYKRENINEIIQSLQKYPKYIIMESEYKVVDKELTFSNSHITPSQKLKTIINSDGKQEGIIKEIIW